MTNTATKRPGLRTGLKTPLNNQSNNIIIPEVPEIVSIDPGFAQCKIRAGEWRYMFPSVVKRRSEVVANSLEDAEGFLITDETGIWNVGTKGSYDLKAERLTSESDIPKMLAMLGLYTEHTGKSVIDLMVSGLPIEEFKIAEAMQDFTERLKGTFTFGFGRRQHTIVVKDSLTLPQSAGAFFDYILDTEGNEDPEHVALAAEDLLVFDIGGKSSDGCIMEAGLFSQDSFTLWQGVHRVRDELRKLILKKYKYNAPLYTLDNVLKTRILRLGGAHEDITDLLITAVETVFPEIRDELSIWVPDFRRFSAILLAGGGADLFGEYIEDLTKIPTICTEDPEYANVNGYSKYGRLKYKEGLL